MTAVNRVKSKRSKSRRSRSSGKCLRPGPVGRNPYLNFLRQYRKSCCGMSPTETVKQGAKAWNQLKPDERLRYIEEAFYAPKPRRQNQRVGSVMKRKVSGRRSRSGRRGGKRMSRSGRKRSRKSGRSRSKGRSRSTKRSSQATIMCHM